MENVRIQPRHHPRCGTSFLFVVIFVSILVSSVVFGIWPITNVWLRTLAHLTLLPLVVGITYEFNRWVGRHVQDSRLAKILTAPGMWMQNFTTNEPDDSMIECAIRSLELVLPSEKGKTNGEFLIMRRIMATTYNNLYLDIRQQLRRAGIEEATLEARELVCFGTNKSREELARDGGLYASPELEHRVRDLVRRHLEGEPVAYLIGEWEFYGPRWTSPGTC